MRYERRNKRRSLAIERSREARLWVSTISIIIAGMSAYMDNHPDVKSRLGEKWDRLKAKLLKRNQ